MSYMLAALLLSSLGTTHAQRVGTAIPEVHPKLPTQKCSKAGGCVTHATSIVADAICNPNPRGKEDWLMDKSICPDAATCGKNCEFEGVDYESIGVTTNGSALTMRLFMPNKTGGYDRASARIYLLAEDEMNYEPVRLLDQEFTFDVDMSLLGCGLNGALYLDEMDMSGSRSENNPAGAQYGTGYCDAQCYNKTMINAEPNLNNSGACCHEMDIWEANGLATAMAPHTCSKPGPFLCTGDECGKSGVCDKPGCGMNPYKTVGPKFYGPGLVVDTKRPFTVVTQFWTAPDNSTAAGKVMSEIRRVYLQDGQRIAEDKTTITPEFCTSNNKTDFDRLGGVKAAGEALDRGMVLIFSIWNDETTFMNWLDSGSAGPCGPEDGTPEKILAANPDVAVTFSNLRWGDIGSTTPA
ncbi:endo-beta-1-4-glucanase celB [Apiospora kogelbergensis]|uniref:endo-beta-1-4-glucanase celB n=1 Tax=Apiospora kogelbergensis TaxID=1337665 RepID=UPI0031303B92